MAGEIGQRLGVGEEISVGERMVTRRLANTLGRLVSSFIELPDDVITMLATLDLRDPGATTVISVVKPKPLPYYRLIPNQIAFPGMGDSINTMPVNVLARLIHP